ncbi:MAG: hypothetical protein K2I42_03145 [Anaeroplasmataceae bacterium]|nr:hypothetical protein [Anaeroplasmataceae bacterium]
MKKYKIDYSFLLLFIILLFSPKQHIIFKLLLCLILHEFGHIFFVYIFHFKIKKLKLSAFGFFLELEPKKENFIKDIFLYSGGILLNGIAYFIFPDSSMKTINLILIIVNLIPIYPLDGFNLLKTIFSYFFSYYYSLKISFYISIFINTLIVLWFCFMQMDLIIIMNYLYLFILNVSFGLHQNIILNRFILERQLYHFEYPVKKIHFHENIKKHIYKYFKIEMKLSNKCISEDDLLELYQRTKI